MSNSFNFPLFDSAQQATVLGQTPRVNPVPQAGPVPQPNMPNNPVSPAVNPNTTSSDITRI